MAQKNPQFQDRSVSPPLGGGAPPGMGVNQNPYQQDNINSRSKLFQNGPNPTGMQNSGNNPYSMNNNPYSQPNQNHYQQSNQ